MNGWRKNQYKVLSPIPLPPNHFQNLEHSFYHYIPDSFDFLVFHLFLNRLWRFRFRSHFDHLSRLFNFDFLLQLFFRRRGGLLSSRRRLAFFPSAFCWIVVNLHRCAATGACCAASMSRFASLRFVPYFHFLCFFFQVYRIWSAGTASASVWLLDWRIFLLMNVSRMNSLPLFCHWLLIAASPPCGLTASSLTPAWLLTISTLTGAESLLDWSGADFVLDIPAVDLFGRGSVIGREIFGAAPVNCFFKSPTLNEYSGFSFVPGWSDLKKIIILLVKKKKVIFAYA